MAPSRAHDVLTSVVVAAAATVTGVLRAAWLDLPPALDEAGYLVIGGSWTRPLPPGTATDSALYGGYWLDRPPGLVAIAQAVATTGVDHEVRVLHLLGLAAAVAVVLGCAFAAHQLLHGAPSTTSRRVGTGVAAVAAAVWVSSPLMGTPVVNGELLAAPFTSLGIGLVGVAVSRRESGRRRAAWLAAAGAGLSGAAAASVKQNMVEVFVVALVALVGLAATRSLRWRSVVGIATAGGVGALVGVVAVTGWALLQGTTLDGVWYATYGFRLDVLTQVPASRAAADARRGVELAYAAVRSGLPLVVLALVWRLLRRPGSVWAWALAAAWAFGVVSVTLGGSYWQHYLVQLVVPAAVTLGWLVGASERPRTPAVVSTVALAVVAVIAAPSWVAVDEFPATDPATQVGRSIAAVADPTDDLVMTVPAPELLRASTLRSPYPYLWGLPAFVRDPGSAELLRLVRRGEPTWVVTTFPDSPITQEVEALVGFRYRLVGRACGTGTWLRVGVDRPAPAPPGRCR